VQTDVSLSLRSLNPGKGARIILIQGFGQLPDCRVTEEMAASLREAFPHAEVPDPIATAEMLGDDITLQLPFDQQSYLLLDLLLSDQRETHVCAYSQGGFAVAELLSRRRYPHVASVMLIGTPLTASRERSRIERLIVSDMGGMFEYVHNEMPVGVSLSGVVCFKPTNSRPTYVGISERYARSFPSDAVHYRNLRTVMDRYRTTVVSLGAEAVTDCTPVNARRLFEETWGMPFADSMDDLDPIHRSQGIVIEGAPHRLGQQHRQATLPRLYSLRTELAEFAFASPAIS
jgi:pimeloyl-ACP methyl ester carboxylesterase